jgi:hypothetical protein
MMEESARESIRKLNYVPDPQAFFQCQGLASRKDMAEGRFSTTDSTDRERNSDERER